MLNVKTTQRSTPINIATSNAKKAANVAAELAAYGISAVYRPIHLIECQSDSIVQIARSKAAQAFEECGGHLIVEDSGFYIPTLRGFPTPKRHISSKPLVSAAS
jgi:XTP/dITP diphosphohydrolase